MRKRINPVVAVVVVIVALVGIGLLASTLTSATQHEAKVIVKPSNPDDPKFHPPPKLNLSDSGT